MGSAVQRLHGPAFTFHPWSTILPRPSFIARFDDRLSDSVQEWCGAIDGPMVLAADVGSPIAMVAATVLTVAALIVRRRPREALFMSLSAGGALMINPVLRMVIGRERPKGRQYLMPMPQSCSFPSGHAMGTAATMASLVIVADALVPSRRVRHALILGAGLTTSSVGLCRVYFGVHFPSDVIGGQFAAVVWVSAMHRWFQRVAAFGLRCTAIRSNPITLTIERNDIVVPADVRREGPALQLAAGDEMQLMKNSGQFVPGATPCMLRDAAKPE